MASSSSSSRSSDQASSSGLWKYDVFLSFRGEDTRNTFVGHLYSALEQQGISTYKDDETLPRGESIRPSLMKAIEESQIAIIIFSKNYGDSSWCLDELTYIMKCKDSRGQTVTPIFYDVDPSEVRKQKRKYGEAFAKHQLENTSKVESWRKALEDASNISGWEPSKVANGDESKCIKQIVSEISQKLHLVTPRANENLIGMAARLQGLRSELQIRSGGVRMIGIWGFGGGGKTTLASSIYDEISSKFDGCCFIENIREESSKNGLVTLQEKILKGVLKQRKGPVIGRVEEGRRMLLDRLCRRKVLIVLDDVDQLDQLEALAGSHDWFGEGSRVIITTRDQHVLCKVNVIYDISLLNDREAMELFCKHAPRGDHKRIEDYEVLAKEVVSYAGGLPLAVKVLGCFLCDKDMDVWRSALARLKEIPDTDIVEKLKISFDGLKPVEKDIFLDIACFYRRMDTDTAMERLNACGFHSGIGVKVLIQKALITISNGREDSKVFDMHDLVQEMGHHIVRGEHPNNPEKHSRVWKEEAVLKLCAMDETTELDKIEAIRFKRNRAGPFHRLPHIVAKIKNLRMIDWTGDPLPTNFLQQKLCYLRLTDCLLKPLWEGYKFLPNLKMMELWCLKKLIRTPKFDGFPNLERLRLNGCVYLEEIHPSIGHLERLVFLSIKACYSLKMFPPITGLKKLETLSFLNCNQLFKSSEIQQQNMEDSGDLYLDNSTAEVASDTNSFVDCRSFRFSNFPGAECCLEESSSPHNHMSHIGFQFFLNDLRDLNLHCCGLGDKELGFAVWQLPNLITLDLSDNPFSRLNFRFLRLPRLKRLDVTCCYDLVQLSDLPSSMAVVIADKCYSLESLGDISNYKCLRDVSLRGWMKNNDGGKLLDSMLLGNATQDCSIQVHFDRWIPKRFVGRLFRSTPTYTLRLPDDWYNHFSGFLICVVTDMLNHPVVDIVIKQEVDEDSQFEVGQDSNEVVEPQYVGTKTCVGFISFGPLRHTTFANSLYTKMSVELKNIHKYVGVELVPRESKVDQPQKTKVTTDPSNFESLDRKKTYIIQDDLKSITIKWLPCDRSIQHPTTTISEFSKLYSLMQPY